LAQAAVAVAVAASGGGWWRQHAAAAAGHPPGLSELVCTLVLQGEEEGAHGEQQDAKVALEHGAELVPVSADLGMMCYSPSV
jgi:hypothetical protein